MQEGQVCLAFVGLTVKGVCVCGGSYRDRKDRSYEGQSRERAKDCDFSLMR